MYTLTQLTHQKKHQTTYIIKVLNMAPRRSGRKNKDAAPSEDEAAAANIDGANAATQVSTAGNNNNETEQDVDTPSTVATTASTATAASSLTGASSAATQDYINRLLESNRRLKEENTSLKVEVSADGRKRRSQG